MPISLRKSEKFAKLMESMSSMQIILPSFDVDSDGKQTMQSQISPASNCKKASQKRIPYKIVDISIRKAICEYAERNKGTTQDDIRRWVTETFEFPCAPAQSSISRILSNKRHWLNMDVEQAAGRKVHRKVRHPELENALALWIRQERSKGNILSGDAIIAHAKRLQKNSAVEVENRLGFSPGWLDKFLRRHGFRRTKQSGKHNENGALTRIDEVSASNSLPVGGQPSSPRAMSHFGISVTPSSLILFLHEVSPFIGAERLKRLKSLALKVDDRLIAVLDEYRSTSSVDSLIETIDIILE
jgi:hypothetical protein